MNFPRMTPLSRRLMTSKIRFLGDGAGDVYVKCYFLLLSTPSRAPLGPWKPCAGPRKYKFRPYLNTSSSRDPTSRHASDTYKNEIDLTIHQPRHRYHLQRKTHDEHPTPYTPAYLRNWVPPYPSPLKVITHFNHFDYLRAERDSFRGLHSN